MQTHSRRDQYKMWWAAQTVFKWALETRTQRDHHLTNQRLISESQSKINGTRVMNEGERCRDWKTQERDRGEKTTIKSRERNHYWIHKCRKLFKRAYRWIWKRNEEDLWRHKLQGPWWKGSYILWKIF